MIDYLKELWLYRHIPITQAVVDLKRGVREMRLGPIWWILDPLLLMLVYYFIVVIIFKRGGPNYAVFLLSGLIPWQWFSTSLSSCTVSIRQAKGLVLQVKVPIFSLQLGSLLVNLVYMLVGLVVVLVFAHHVPGLELVYLIPVIAAQGAFTLGLGSLLAILNVFAADTQRFLSPLLRMWMYISPLMYDASLVQNSSAPSILKDLYMLNPFVPFLDAYHQILLHGQVPDLTGLIGWGCGSVALLIVGLTLTHRAQGHLLKFV